MHRNSGLFISADFVNSWKPWFLRGGNWNNSTGDGVMSFSINNGQANSNYSFRLGAVRDYNIIMI